MTTKRYEPCLQQCKLEVDGDVWMMFSSHAMEEITDPDLYPSGCPRRLKCFQPHPGFQPLDAALDITVTGIGDASDSATAYPHHRVRFDRLGDAVIATYLTMYVAETVEPLFMPANYVGNGCVDVTKFYRLSRPTLFIDMQTLRVGGSHFAELKQNNWRPKAGGY